MTTGLVVDREKHEYHVDGRKVLSITDCMKSAGVIENVHGSDYDLWVGTATHRAIELHINGTLNYNTLDPALVPRVLAWDEFVKHTGFIPRETEKAIYNFNMRVAGMLDVLGEFPDGAEGIVELKSGNVSKWTGVQTAGQDMLMGGKQRRRFGLKVPAVGKPNVAPFTDVDDYLVFRAAVTIANWKNK
jgi:hypothetical protein